MPRILATLLALLALLAGCFVELDEQPACFAEGGILSAAPFDTEACCTFGEDAPCIALYSDSEHAALASLGTCSEQGYCVLNCQRGVNCECFDDRDCLSADGRPSCRAGTSAAECMLYGMDSERCSICAP